MDATAARVLRRNRDLRSRFDEDDAVQRTALKLLRAARRGRIDTAAGEPAFASLCRHSVVRTVIGEQARRRAPQRAPARDSGAEGSEVQPKVRGHAAHVQATRLQHTDDLDLLASAEPSFEQRIIAADTLSGLLALLDPESAEIALLCQKGYSLAAIAAKAGVAERTVSRRLAAIRTIWANSGLLSASQDDSRN